MPGTCLYVYVCTTGAGAVQFTYRLSSFMQSFVPHAVVSFVHGSVLARAVHVGPPISADL